MIWVYILLDAVIVALLGVLCYMTLHLLTKKNGLNAGSLSQFRNDDLYAQSMEDKKRLAHIEETVMPPEEYTNEPEPDKSVSDDDIIFSSGYGTDCETEDTDED